MDHRARPVTQSSQADLLSSLAACAELDAIYADCVEAHSNFDLSAADFRDAVIGAINKYLVGFKEGSAVPSTREISRFVGELQNRDLFLALACARGNEHAWWEFDRQHRSFIERWARHLVRNGTDADEVIDLVYVELFGTRVSGGVRQSKFRTYTGRGTLRGWLRAVILHTVVDLYRGRKAEVPPEDWSGNDDAREPRGRFEQMRGTEETMLAKVVRDRYKSAAIAALDQSLTALDDHETLLLLYYHVEGLKLREIARIVEQPMSPIRRWFQRQSKRRGTAPSSRVHESTIMRWLEKVYQKVSDRFHAELANKHGLNAAEIEICKAIATEDPAQDIRLDRVSTQNEDPEKERTEGRQAEGAS
jgi:RNA polymerase sigma-70 factor